MVTAPVITPPTQPARGRGWAGRCRPSGGGHARYYALPSRTKAFAYDSVITGIIPVCHRDASVLFDPGYTYSYVSSYFSLYLGVFRDSLSSPIHMSTPMGNSIVVHHVYRSCLIVFGGFETRADLLLLSIVEFDIILGLDWLSKTMMLAMPGLPRIQWRGALNYVPSRVISFLKAQHIVVKGCNAYLAFVRDVSVDTPTVESVPVMRDFPDVFPVDLPVMPPYRDIDFGIDWLPGTQFISIPPYRMDTTELIEFKE
ncbi:uncharacterized protein [Nicotiana sylvestris]|uniref:uncharacterized protein n=1 Tax=Nicotiana sylvestris TaxID=4096 RepID=UPI00388C61B1